MSFLGDVKFYRRILASDYDRYEADGWTDPVAHYIPSIEEPILVLEKKVAELPVKPQSDTVKCAVAVLSEVQELLIVKNAKYGDSAANPIRVFSRATPEEQLLVRIDDKLSRIARGDGLLEVDEDVVVDLIGYLALYAALKRKDR